jgi:hypothetical protein
MNKPSKGARVKNNPSFRTDEENEIIQGFRRENDTLKQELEAARAEKRPKTFNIFNGQVEGSPLSERAITTDHGISMMFLLTPSELGEKSIRRHWTIQNLKRLRKFVDDSLAYLEQGKPKSNSTQKADE